MDQKSWLWKKRSAEKTLVADKATNSSSKYEEVNEVQKLMTEKTDLERDLRISDEKLSSALSECNAKDDIAKKQVKIAEEAIAGWEKAESEVICLKQQVAEVLQQKMASEERIDHLDVALKECMQQLRFVREEQEKRIHGAVTKTSEDFEKIRIALDAENTKLTKALSEKDKVIEDLGRYGSQVEAKSKALLLRVESTEKENASLKYEVRVLEKELDIRNEERECNRRSADIARKQQQERAKKIVNLETECQRLRLLVQIRLPGPATLANMRSEVETLDKVRVEMMRKKSNPSPPTTLMEFCTELSHDAPTEKINLLTEQLYTMVEENRVLKDALAKKSSELQCSRNMYARTASKQVEESHNSDVGSDDKASCAESWASALISELDHFKNEKQMRTLSYRNMGAADMNLMDDFVEMEKLAVISVDYPAGSSHYSSEEGNAIIQTSSAKSLNLDASDMRNGNNISNSEKSDKKLGSNVTVSINKVIGLLEGINVQSQGNGEAEFSSGKDDKILSYRNSENPTGYIVRVFQWKVAELSAILQQFVRTCNDLLNGKAGFEQFVQQLASDLEWIINHCFSLQDVSSMKDAIRNHLYWDGSRSESEVDSESDDHLTGCNKLHIQRDDVSYPSIEAGKPRNVEWEDKESSILDSEGCPQSEIVKGECVLIHLQESYEIVENLYSEMETMEQSRENFANQIEKQMMIKEELETQLMETNHEWRKACERISHLENELENKSNSFTKLEETCHGLKIQIQSMTNKDVSDNGKHREKLLQSDWEITAASEKLAECQETILNLGKQLKALASPNDAALFDKVISKTTNSAATSLPMPMKNISRRSSLLNKMLAEDNDPHGSSPNIRKVNQNGESYSSVSTNAATVNMVKSTHSERFNQVENSRNAVASTDIVPCKKNGGRSFLKKLFWPQKKGNSDKTPIS